MAKYLVITALMMGTVRIAENRTVELDDDEAEGLLACGAVVLFDAHADDGGANAAAAEAQRIADEEAAAAEARRIADEEAAAAEALRVADEEAAATQKAAAKPAGKAKA